jgi:cell division transport system ATP-binding protein
MIYQTMIVLKNVSKIYPPNNVALENVSFEVKQGEFVLLVGKSGAGKTTILKLISREDKPTRGKIFYKGLDYQKLRSGDVPKLRRKITTIFQDFKILGDRSVAENIALVLQILGYKMIEMRRRIDEMLKLVDLNPHGPILAKYLSGGEKQRLAIARALSMNPEVILADEPTGNLDPINTKIIIDLLKRVNSNGVSIILATHNREVVDYLRKRVILLSDGRIIKDENPGKFTLA